MLKWGHFNFRVTLHDYNIGGVSQHHPQHTHTHSDTDTNIHKTRGRKKTGSGERRDGGKEETGRVRDKKMDDKVTKDWGGKESETAQVARKGMNSLSNLKSRVRRANLMKKKNNFSNLIV